MPFCERCPEKRLVCLSIHHVHGKQEDVFETLCHNCHASYHAADSGNITYEEELAWIEQQRVLQSQREEKRQKILKLKEEGWSIQQIADFFNTSRQTVSKYLITETNPLDLEELESPEIL